MSYYSLHINLYNESLEQTIAVKISLDTNDFGV